MEKRQHTRNFIKKILGNNSGASLAIVMIIMVLFLTLGAAILAAASGTTASTGQKETSQQAVYAASSAMEVIGESILSGDLGKPILKEITENVAISSELEARTIRPEISFTGESLSSTSIKDVTITYEKPELEPQTTDPVTKKTTSYTLKLNDVVVQLTAEDQSKQTYTVEGHFSFSGGVHLQNEAWGWQGTWSKEYISQPKN